MTKGLIPVEDVDVPRGRSRNPFNEPIEAIAEMLSSNPQQWFIIGTSTFSERSRLNNAASLLRNNKYTAIREYYDKGEFETRVSGAKNSPHSAEHEVVAFARFIPNG